MDNYQRAGQPLIQHRAWWIGAGMWIVWNWASASWDVLDKPETKK